MRGSRIRLTIIALIGIGVAWTIYQHRIRLETWVWHYRHGASVTVGDYIVPVPANWYVEDLNSSDKMLFRIDTDDRSPTRRLKAHAGIMLLLGRQRSTKDLDVLRSFEIASLKKHGAEPGFRTLALNGEAVTCVGGVQEVNVGYDVDPIHWNCMLSSGLQVLIGSPESDLKQTWEIVSNIRKKA